MENNLSLSMDDFKGSNVEKSFESELEKAAKLGPLGPGKWITVDGRHVYLNNKGEVVAGKVFGKDGEEVKKLTGTSGSGSDSFETENTKKAISQLKEGLDRASKMKDGEKETGGSGRTKEKIVKELKAAIAEKENSLSGNDKKAPKEAKKITAEGLNDKMYEYLKKEGIKDIRLKADDVSGSGHTTIMIDINGGGKKMEGMQIIYDSDENKYEVSEYQAGPKGEDLMIFGEYKTVEAALKQALKGNSTEGGQTPKEVWDNDTKHKGAKPYAQYKKEQEEKANAGKEAPADKEEKKPINPKDWKDGDKSKEGNMPTIDTFKKIAKESKDADEFMAKAKAIKNVPQDVADEFESKYGGGSMKQAAQKFMDEHGVKGQADSKGNDKPITEKEANPQNFVPGQHKESAMYKEMSTAQKRRVDELESFKNVNWDKVGEDFKEKYDESIYTMKEAISDMTELGDYPTDAEVKEVEFFKKVKSMKDPVDQALAFVTSNSSNEYAYVDSARKELLDLVGSIKKESPDAFKTNDPNQLRLFKSRISDALNNIK